eukprot:3435288-Prymnesium_polylepis.2
MSFGVDSQPRLNVCSGETMSAYRMQPNLAKMPIDLKPPRYFWPTTHVPLNAKALDETHFADRTRALTFH